MILLGLIVLIVPWLQRYLDPPGSGGGIDLFGLYVIFAFMFLAVAALAAFLLLYKSNPKWEIAVAATVLGFSTFIAIFAAQPVIGYFVRQPEDPDAQFTLSWFVPVVSSLAAMDALLFIGWRKRKQLA